MKTITWRELRENLADMLNLVRYTDERLVITRHGKPIVDIVIHAGSDEATKDPKINGSGKIVDRRTGCVRI